MVNILPITCFRECLSLTPRKLKVVESSGFYLSRKLNSAKIEIAYEAISPEIALNLKL